MTLTAGHMSETMDRSAWLKEVRRVSEESMDDIYAGIYDENWGAFIDPTHQKFIAKFLNLCPAGATILDAACGTGKYWPLILSSGRKVFGVDQSKMMLARAREKFPDVRTEKIGLQELAYQEAFDGAICMDAMENVFPEDWPLVMGNLHRAIKPKGHLYFTVELAKEEDIERAFTEARQMGLPVMFGEWTHEGAYHYYPKKEGVKEWLDFAGFHVIEEKSAPFAESDSPMEEDQPYIGEGYYHILIQKI